MSTKEISLIFPVYNEKECLKQLYAEAISVIDVLGLDYEIIFVDDGSKDGSLEFLRDLETQDRRMSVIHLNKHLGKTQALCYGFMQAKGDIIVTMDSDLQDDPKDIPYFIQKLKEGYGLVCGWRWKRKTGIFKAILSNVFNVIVSLITGIRLHDINCGIKAFKKEAVDTIKLYSGLHRYIPVLVYLKGYKVTEVKVNCRTRKYGRSKYGIGRYIIACIDLFRIMISRK